MTLETYSGGFVVTRQKEPHYIYIIIITLTNLMQELIQEQSQKSEHKLSQVFLNATEGQCFGRTCVLDGRAQKKYCAMGLIYLYGRSS